MNNFALPKFEWAWCELCDAPFIRCPKCSNNCCNGTYGRDENNVWCDVCPLAYQYQDLCFATNEQPQNEVDVARANDHTTLGWKWDNEDEP